MANDWKKGDGQKPTPSKDHAMSNEEWIKRYGRISKRVRVPSIEETKAAYDARAEQADRQNEINAANEKARKAELDDSYEAAQRAERLRMAKMSSAELLELGDMKARMKDLDKKDAENRRLQKEPFPACKVVGIQPLTVKVDTSHPACPKGVGDTLQVSDALKYDADGQLLLYRAVKIDDTGVLRSDCSSGIAPRWIFVRGADKQENAALDGGGTVNA